jgi:hypothetical protein
MMRLGLDFETLSKVGSIHISKGNGKISSRVGVFNLPVRRTCPFAGICAGYCYGIRAENGWPFVTCSRWDNFWATRRASFVDEMVARITKMQLLVVRASYGEALAEMARRLPDRRFYLYTKSIPYVRTLKQEQNCTVIFSYGGVMDSLINPKTDNYARVVDSVDEVQPGEYLCPAVAHAETEVQKICGRYCTYCQGNGYQVRVCFIKELKGKNWTTNTQHASRANSAQSALTVSQIAQPDLSDVSASPASNAQESEQA